jgi:2-polyprenyl-3-methyl-5-hydroxy-6-metoxy-1,4-benzoquinol methylase
MASELDPAKLEAFGARALDILNKAGVAVMISVGHRTGLFEVLATLPPSTSAEIAAAAHLQERYVREWLAAMVTGGVIEHVPETGTYQLPAEHAAFLTKAAATNNIASFAQIIPLICNVEDDVVACFEHGGGVPYSAYRRFPEVMRELSAPVFDTLLVDKILPLAPGLVASLTAGADVLEVGCGSGHAVNVMARAFPNSRFVGYDLIAEQIASARQEATAWGLANARFDVHDVARLDEREHYDLVMAFDTVHDQARPAALLDEVAAALKPGGTFLMWDVGASSHLHNNKDHLLGPLLYATSCMHCMTVSLAQGGEGLGAMWGEEKARAMLAAAGLAGTQVYKLEEDPVNSCYIAIKTPAAVGV